MCTLLHVSGITGKSLGSAVLYKTSVEVHKPKVRMFQLFYATVRSLVGVDIC
jgi:hypothetical protein